MGRWQVNVTKEENGTWTARVYYRDYDGDQRRKTKRGFETEAEAEEWCERFAQENAGAVDVTFERFFETYKADVAPRIRLNTWLTKVDWQPFSGHFSQRLSPAFLNSTGLM
jgi:hypothetical protein